MLVDETAPEHTRAELPQLPETKEGTSSSRKQTAGTGADEASTTQQRCPGNGRYVVLVAAAHNAAHRVSLKKVVRTTANRP